MKVCVIFNPAARGDKARRFRERLGALATQCALRPTFTAGDGRRLAAEAVRQGFQIIVAAGGDGTVNEVVNGINDEPEGVARVQFGLLPLGTVNVFARELRLPRRFQTAWDVIQAGREARLDLGEVEFTEAGQPQRRCFAQFAGIGWDARAVELVDLELKKKVGPLAYVVSGLKATRGSLPEIVVTNNQTTLAGQQVLIGNGRLYGGDFPVFPLADLRDGLLDVTVFPRVNLAAMARAGWGLLFNRLYTSGGARHFKAAAVEARSAQPVSFELEGERVGQLPARFFVRREALRVLAP